MKSEVLLSLVLLFVAFLALPGARCQEDDVSTLADDYDPSSEVKRIERHAQVPPEKYQEPGAPLQRRRRHSPPGPGPDPPFPYPESMPGKPFAVPQKIYERVRRSAKGTGALPQRKG